MSSSARVLALVPDAFGGRGGIAQYNRDLLTTLKACTVVTGITVLPRYAPDPVSCPPGIVQKKPRSSRLVYVICGLIQALWERADIVFCGHLYVAPLALVIARLTGAKLVVQAHGIEAWRRPNMMIRRASEAADLILCVSRYTRARVLSWAVIAPERVLVLSNTVGRSFSPGLGSALREELGVTGKKVLLSVGRLSSTERYKGHDRVIAAMPALLRQGHDVVYVIVGEGDDRSRLHRLVTQAELGERVRFVGGVASEKLLGYYRMADLFVLPSTGEGFGIAFLEAMASGTRALGLAIGGACDALGDGELGVAVGEDKLSEALATALGMPDGDREKTSKMVLSRFGREAFALQVASLASRLAPCGAAPSKALGQP